MAPVPAFRFAAGLVAVAVLSGTFSTAAPVPAGGGGRLEGVLLGVDGRPSAGFRVHLIDATGAVAAVAATATDGRYAFEGLIPGRYSIAIENPVGQFAPLDGPPIRLAAGRPVRRDLGLVSADRGARETAAGSRPGPASWWGNLSTPAKLWVVVAGAVVGGLAWAAISDDEESPATPSGAN